MAILPNGAGGYQVGDGNLTEISLTLLFQQLTQLPQRLL
jgi:hypothetical protein